MSTVIITVRVDPEALRSILADATSARDDAAERMRDDSRGGYGIYSEGDRAAFTAKSERDAALSGLIEREVSRAVEAAREMAQPLDVETGDAHEHDWRLVEDGYTRHWSSEIDATERTIRAGDDSTTDEGTGEYLECGDCLTRRHIPEGYTISWIG